MQQQSHYHKGKEMITLVVIPTHNNIKTIDKCLRSIIDSSVKPDAIVIGDDDSSDGTYESLCKFLRAEQVVVEDKKGWPPQYESEINGIKIIIFRKRKSNRAHTLNTCLQIGPKKADVIFFANPASWYCKDKIKLSIECFKIDQSIACVVTDFFEHNFDDNGKEIVVRQFCNSFDSQRLLAKYEYDFNFAITTQVFANLKHGFDVRFKTREDYDFIVKVSEFGLIYHLPEPLHHRIYDLNHTDEHSQIEDIVRKMTHQRRMSNGKKI